MRSCLNVRRFSIYPLAVLWVVIPTVGDAANVSFTPAALSFGSVALTESKSLKAVFKNRSALNVRLTEVSIHGAHAADFSQTNTCPNPLPARSSCVFKVAFTPTALTARSATLTVSTDDPAAPTAVLALAGNPYPGALNDSGITRCGDAKQNGLTCPVTEFPRQDAEFGRDKTHNSSANGRAGFNFTKLDAGGAELPASATAWDCVRDNVTGLVWEVKSLPDDLRGNQGLHDADDLYTWYSTDSTNNGGVVGYSGKQNTCDGYQAGQPATYCNTQAYVKRVNAAGWCGARDWRVPSVVELRSLVDLSQPYPKPNLDLRYFPDELGYPRWSSTPGAYTAINAWVVNFGDGYSNPAYRFDPYPVRLVRGGQ